MSLNSLQENCELSDSSLFRENLVTIFRCTQVSQLCQGVYGFSKVVDSLLKLIILKNEFNLTSEFVLSIGA